MKRWSWLVAIVALWCLQAGAQNVREYIPERAWTHKETIAQELDRLFPALSPRAYVPALIEHESCITLKHSRCWSSTSRLKTAREEGAGLSQITRAYHADGRLRFDKLSEMRARYKEELREASWDTIYQRADVQIRMMVLMLRDDYGRLYEVKDSWERLAMTDAAYNGGIGGLHKERRACSLRKGCDAQKWFGHVEKVCLKSQKVLYGGRSACAINRAHTLDVMTVRLDKYKAKYGI